MGTIQYAGSESAAASLNVTGPTPTVTSLAATGSAGNYTMTATVYGNGNTAPAGSVSFLNTSSSNAELGAAALANAGADYHVMIL